MFGQYFFSQQIFIFKMTDLLVYIIFCPAWELRVPYSGQYLLVVKMGIPYSVGMQLHPLIFVSTEIFKVSWSLTLI